MALLEINALSVRFGGVAAVTDVSLAVEAGEIHGIIGPNGAGKTSLINAVTGMVVPQSGSIRLNGKEIARTAPHVISSFGLGRTFQHVELFGDRTVFDNVLTGFYRHQSYGLFAASIRFGKAAASEQKTHHQARVVGAPFDRNDDRPTIGRIIHCCLAPVHDRGHRDPELMAKVAAGIA